MSPRTVRSKQRATRLGDDGSNDASAASLQQDTASPLLLPDNNVNNDQDIIQRTYISGSAPVASTSTSAAQVPLQIDDISPQTKLYIDSNFAKHRLEVQERQERFLHEIKSLLSTIPGLSLPSNNTSSTSTDKNTNTTTPFNNDDFETATSQQQDGDCRHPEKRLRFQTDDSFTANDASNGDSNINSQGELNFDRHFTTYNDVARLLGNFKERSVREARQSAPLNLHSTEQDTILGHNSIPPSSDGHHIMAANTTELYSSWSIRKYTPINYKDNFTNSGSEVENIIDPIAKETELTRL